MRTGKMLPRLLVNRCFSLSFLLLIFCSVPTCAVGKSRHGEKDDLSYTLQVVQDGVHSRIHVAMTFAEDASGKGALRLPKEEGDGNTFSTPVQALHSLSPDVQVSDTPDPFLKAIAYPPHKRVQVAYDLVQSWPGTVVAHGVYQKKAILLKDYFHSFGNAFWVFPDWSKSKPHVVTMHWKDLPAGWQIANSFGTGHFSQTFRASLDEIADGIYTGGDFRIGTVSVRGKPVYIAMRGQGWTFKDTDLCEIVGRIITIERDFWKDYHQTYMLVTLIPTQDELGTFTGQGRTNAFALFLPQAAPLSYFFKHTLAHECFHLWLPGQMNSLDPPIWFFEGFTDYFASQLLLRAGVASVGEVADFYNVRIKDYYLSPVRNIGGEQARNDMFKSNPNFQLPYERGLLLAIKWDQDLQSATGKTHRLDKVIVGLVKLARKKNLGPFNEAILALLKPDLKGTAEADLLRYIQNGETLAPLPQTLGPDVRLQMQEFRSSGAGTVQVPQFRVAGK